MRRVASWLVAAALAVGGGAVCRSDPPSPEVRIRALLESAETALEEGDVSRVKELVSERYRDPRGNDRRGIAAYLSLLVLQNRPLHLLSRVREVGFPEAKRAEVRVVAGMAATPTVAGEERPRLRADVYTFDLELADEGDGDWKVVRADWRPTSAGELF